MKKLIIIGLMVTLGIASLYSFYHRGLKVPLKVTLGISENNRRGGDFWATFPAGFVYKYNAVLPEKTIANSQAMGRVWYYGPVQHLITLPLTSLTSIRAVGSIWLLANYFFLFAVLALVINMLKETPFFLKLAAIFLWLAYSPLHLALEEGVIELFELAMIVFSLFSLYRKREITAGAALGLAAMTKFLPIIFFPYLLIRRKFKAALTMAVTIGIIAVATQFTLGWQNSGTLKMLREEVSAKNYQQTYWRSQTLPSLIGRAFSSCDYSAREVCYPKAAESGMVKRSAAMAVLFAFLAAFYILYRRRASGDLSLDYGIVAVLMVMVPTHGQYYYLTFCLIGYSFALKALYERRNDLAAALAALSYFLTGYIVQMREFDKILLPGYTDINREIFFNFLSFPAYGVVLLFAALILICLGKTQNFLKKP